MLSEPPFVRDESARSQLDELDELENQLDAYSSLSDQDQDLVVLDNPIARLDLQNTLDFLIQRINILVLVVGGSAQCTDFTDDKRIVLTDLSGGETCDLLQSALVIDGQALLVGLDDGTGLVVGSVPTGAATGSTLQFLSLTTTERDFLTGVDGMVVWNETDLEFQGYNSGWASLGGGGGIPHLADGTVAHFSGEVSTGDNVQMDLADAVHGLPTTGDPFTLNFQFSPVQERSSANFRDQRFLTCIHRPLGAVPGPTATLPDGGTDFVGQSGTSNRAAFGVSPFHFISTGATRPTSCFVVEIGCTGTAQNPLTGFGPLIEFSRQLGSNPAILSGGSYFGMRANAGGLNSPNTFELVVDQVAMQWWHKPANMIDWASALFHRMRHTTAPSGAHDTSKPGYAPAPSSNDALLWVENGELWIRPNGGTAKNFCANTGEVPGEVVTQSTSNGGATITQQGNEFTVVLPASGSLDVTVATPFIPGSVVEMQCTVSVDATGGTLTNVAFGDGTDVNRWGDLTVFTINSSRTREFWTVNNEVQFGFYMTATQAGAINIVLTATGDWGGGTIVIVIHQKAATIIGFV